MIFKGLGDPLRRAMDQTDAAEMFSNSQLFERRIIDQEGKDK